jgi:hypothetical protein
MYGAPDASPFVSPGPPPGFGPGPGARAPTAHCQMGHEIVPGASYCAQGHPIALDQIQFTNDGYPSPGGFGAPLPPSYGSPAPPLPPLPGPGFGMPLPSPAAFGSSLAQPGFGAPPLAPAYGGRSEPAPPKALRGFLVAYGTNPSGDFWPLTGGRLLVGRFGSTDRIDIALQDPTISSHHAAMLVDAASGAITVEDTGSTNGTFVNDEHIGFNGRRDLHDGDLLRFGAYTTIVKVIGRF